MDQQKAGSKYLLSHQSPSPCQDCLLETTKPQPAMGTSPGTKHWIQIVRVHSATYKYKYRRVCRHKPNKSTVRHLRSNTTRRENLRPENILTREELRCRRRSCSKQRT